MPAATDFPAAEEGVATLRPRCGCVLHGRRLFTGALLGGGLSASLPGLAAAPAECKRSGFTKLAPAESIEQQAGYQYRQMLSQAQGNRQLAPMNHPQLERLQYIAQRIIPFTAECNTRAAQWKWEVNLIGSRQVNAFCMPGGKIAFYYGILSSLKLSDDEVAMVMGHEVAHALLEHAREQMGKNMATSIGARVGAAVLGLGHAGDMAAQVGTKLLALTYSRTDESEADALGLVMAARAGYDPRAGVSLWQKMSQASKGKAPPELLSTHPSGPTRTKDIEARLPKVLPLYQAASKPGRSFGPPTSG